MNVTLAALSPHAACSIFGKTIQTFAARRPHTPSTEPPIEPPLPEPSVDNTITVSSPVTVTDYPFQFGRAFVQGEVAEFAQVILNGEPVPTQCDVKNRWPDDSLKFAIIAVVLPTLTAGIPATVQFVNTDNGNNEPSDIPDIDAEIIITDGSASLRDMIDIGCFERWTSGPIAQTLVCYDRSVDRVFDIGGAHRSLHPWFVVTHWPGLDKTNIRFVGEIGNTEAMDARTYDLDLTVDGVAVYSQDNIAQLVATRWTRTAWHGGAPEPKVNVYHNIAYLRQTGLVPKYDTIVFPESTIASSYSSWLSKNRSIGGNGLWQTYMPNTGGRKDIGLNPGWHVQALLSGDYRDREIMLGQADLAGWWPAHIREGDPVKANMGRTIHCHTRGTYWFLDGRYTPTPQDAVTIINAGSANGWVFDQAHMPAPFTLPYITTGDPYYLDCIEMWQGENCLGNNPGYRNFNHMSTYGQIRGVAWQYRTLFDSAALMPDGDPLQTTFRLMVDEAIAKDEGMHHINTTELAGTPQHVFGASKIGTSSDGWRGYGPPPCRWWGGAGDYSVSDPAYYNLDVSHSASAHWMSHYVIAAIGRGRELGFPTDALIAWMAPFVIGQFNTPIYPPQLVSQYVVPDLKKGPPINWFTSWEDTFTGWSAQRQSGMLNGKIDMVYWGLGETYYNKGRCALSFVTDQPGGIAAWDRCEETMRAKQAESGISTAWHNDPTWAVIP